MSKQLVLISFLAVFLFPFRGMDLQAQKLKTPEGTEYEILRHNDGSRKAVTGDFMLMFVNYAVKRSDKDSIIFNSIANGEGGKMLIQITESTYKGDITEALGQLSEGDSARIAVRADSFFIKSVQTPQLPPFVKSNEMLYFNVGVAELLSEAELQQKIQNEQAKQKAEMLTLKEKELEQLKAYFVSKGLQVSPDENGLFIARQSEGSGEMPVNGKKVQVHYTGTLLDGTKFDSSVDRGTPFSFVLGAGQVIKGWDLGIAKLKPGEKAILGLPSDLAYGARAMGPIPANSPLIFEVQLISYE
ncbi:MAG: FKBP-type peptidyl-prolyl cis-trans isomerase [Bacteroidia bacterium]